MKMLEFLQKIFRLSKSQILLKNMVQDIFSLKDSKDNVLFESHDQYEVRGFAKGYYMHTPQDLYLVKTRIVVNDCTKEYLNATTLKKEEN